MKELVNPPKKLHRTWLRFLPYTGFGALLISLKSAESLQSTWIIYLILMVTQLSIIGIYLLINKSIEKKKVTY